MFEILRKRSHAIGILCAVLAAIINSSIGILNEFAFSKGVKYQDVAFYKTLIAFIIITLYLVISQQFRAQVFYLRKRVKELLILSFTGVFCLYFFETWAFSESNIPLTAFMIYAPGIITVILSVVFLKERATLKMLFSVCMVFVGCYLLVAGNVVPVYGEGILYAFIGGLGYGFFIFLSKIFKIEYAFAALWWCFLFGSILLFIPYYYLNDYKVIFFPLNSMIYIVLLAAFPTILGFLLTMYAVRHAPASYVQILETSDPLFASVAAYIIFSQTLSNISLHGSALILIGLFILSFSKKNKELKNVNDF
ncbi:DMT family transporter [Sodalis sp. RH14]|uniref:DMT family transporter n=1 Tax=Sodalis sp. RH14 TaxID=3394329 RepID=UPI0039B38861